MAENRRLERSPGQIKGWLKTIYPDSESTQVSHETIHKNLFVQAQGVLQKDLVQYIGKRRAMHRSRRYTQKTKRNSRIGNAAPTRGHHSETENRPVPGHWESDLRRCSNNRQFATLVERHTRLVMPVRAPSKDTRTVISTPIKQAHESPWGLYKSLTWDIGRMMANHKHFSLATEIKVYLCEHQEPWQRGSSKSTNGLLRRWYVPKEVDRSSIRQDRLDAVVRQLNDRPRETL